MKRVAEKIRQRWDEEYILSKHGISIKQISIQDLQFKYLKLMESRKNKSWYRRIRSATQHFVDLYGDFNVSEIKTPEIEEYITHRIEKGDTHSNQFGRSTKINGGVAPKTIREEVKILSNMFEYSINHSHSRDNPCKSKSIVLPALRMTKPRKNIPVNLLLKAIKHAKREDDAIFWSILFYTGMRTGDAGNLTKIEIKKDRIEKSQNKTGAKVVIPLHKKLKQYNLVGMMTKTKPTNSRVRFQKIVGTEYDLHSIRHTFASELSRIGASALEVSALLGHSSKSVTEDYVHHNFSKLQNLINKIK
jgi:integrase